jgi:hypothetical protein
MKFNITVDADWIGEDASIDDAIKQEIVNRIVKTVCEKIEKDAGEKAGLLISGMLDKVCNNILDGFLKKKISITDKWGEVVISDTTIEEVLKKRFDEFWNTLVDENGRATVKGYGDVKPRFQWAVDVQIKKQADSFAKELANETASKIKEAMTKAIQDKIGKKLMKELDLDMLKD